MKYIKKYEVTFHNEKIPQSPDSMKFQKGDWVRFNNLTRKNQKDIYEIL